MMVSQLLIDVVVSSKDGGVSTADTVADGGPDDPKEDPTYQPPK